MLVSLAKNVAAFLFLAMVALAAISALTGGIEGYNAAKATAPNQQALAAE